MSAPIAYVCLTGYAGTTSHMVHVIGETPKRFRVRVIESFRVNGRLRDFGDVVLVPKDAVLSRTGGAWEAFVMPSAEASS